MKNTIQSLEIKRYALSYGQQALWLLYRLAPDRAAYNMVYSWKIQGALNIDALKHALQALVDRHPALRTTYDTNEKGEPRQYIHPTMPLKFDEINAVGWSEQVLEQVLSGKIYRPIDLQNGPIVRWSLLKRSEEEYVLLMLIHHIASDKWSVMIMLDDLSKLYSAFTQTDTPIMDRLNLSKNDLTYLDFVSWQKEMLVGKKGNRLWKFWQEQLSGELPTLHLSTDQARPPVVRYRCDIHTLPLSLSLTDKLQELANEENTSMFALYLSAFQILLQRYSGQNDILIGTPTAGRNMKYEGITGYFVSPIVIRTKFEENLPFKEFLQQSQKNISSSLRRWDYPFPLLVEQLHPERDQSRSALTQVYFTLDNPNLFLDRQTPLVSIDENGKEVWDVGELQWERLEPISLLHDFDLYLRINQVESTYSVCLEYNRDILNKQTIQRMTEHYLTLLESIAKAPDTPIHHLSILTTPELKLLLDDWNQTKIRFPFEICSHHWFEYQVGRQPEAPAISFGTEEITYTVLNLRANQVANYLIELGVGADVLVGVYLERSINMIIGIMGIVKAGGAYVPLDPKYPEDRIQMILQASELEIILTQEDLIYKLPNNLRNVNLDDWDTFVQQDTKNPTIEVQLDNLSHLIYTSGSTGIPKGIAIEHKSVSALINWANTVYSQEELSGVLASTSICFDLSVFEIFCTLGLGGSLILVDTALHLSSTPVANKVRLINTVPSAIKELLRMEAIPNTVHTINLAGEPLPQNVVKTLYQLNHIQKVYNLYGPSEDTTYSTFALMEQNDSYAPLISHPDTRMPNTELYVLDKYLNAVPVGVPGELYIAGNGLARGYFKRPDLTEERFLPSPFHYDESKRVYRTGDLVRYLPDGSLDYIGRVDHQVKIRGFRIELGDIEAVLYQNEAVQEVLVMVQEENDDKILVGYVVLKEGKTTDPQALRSFIQEHLPDYMVPSYVVILDAMPLTPNGKIDRKELASIKPSIQKQPVEETHVAPRGEVEKIIAEVWKSVLHVEQISVHDNFFDLGGHSLLMAQVYTQLPRVLKKDLSVVDLFQYPTIYKLAEFLGDEDDPEIFFQIKSDRVERTRRARERLKDVPGLKIAIIGMAGRFPGANSVDAFWQNIKNGVESISLFSDEEMEQEWVDPDLWRHPDYRRFGGVIEDIEQFDANFFGFSPREAQITDPQHRIFLESAWNALENAGIDHERYEGSIGVYAGSGTNSYYAYHIAPHTSLLQTIGSYPILMANDKDYLCSRVSYKLNLEGPGITVQTACSTSLVAVHLACRGLLSGECDLALAGGVSLGTLQKGYLYKEGMIFSKDGKCRPFDEKAQGTVPGQGVGVVALKRLEDALNDNDNINAVIIGSAVNNDGSNKAGYSAPGVEGQTHVIQSAQVMAEVSSESIHYVEAHGTGTLVGDPIEISGLTQAFQTGSSKTQFCAIGSVKSNIGHLDSASGVAGLIKAVLALKHKTIPPSLYYETPNPAIDFENSPFFVNSRRLKWHKTETPRRAGVSSFGLGGTNAHVVLEENEEGDSTQKSRPSLLLVFSAKTPTALEKIVDNLAEYLEQNDKINLADVAYTLQVGRKLLPYRKILVCRNRHEAILKLQAKDPKKIFNSKAQDSAPPVAFMFSGQGSQYVHMWYQLYMVEANFREAIDQCHEILKKNHPEIYHRFTEYDLNCQTERIHETQLTQIIIFITEYAMVTLLKGWGITPSYMIGHSVGEYTAAHFAGVFSLEDAITLVALRGQLINDHVQLGEMLSVREDSTTMETLLGRFSFKDELSLAAINSPSNCVISGPSGVIQHLKRYFQEKGTQCRSLQTSHAFHSLMLDPILKQFESILKEIKFSPPEIPFISNVTGSWITQEEATDPQYWVNHLRGTVHFSQGLSHLVNEVDNAILLEVGPGKVLKTLARQNASTTQKTKIFSTISHPQEEAHDTDFLLTTLGRLWAEGVQINWDEYHSHGQRTRIPLPTYPFERKRYWIDAPKVTASTKTPLDVLPAEDIQAEPGESEETITPFFTQTEQTIADVWQKFLGVTGIGLHDDFFELGGDSMIAVGLLAQLQDLLGEPLSSHVLMNHSTIAELAEFIEKEKATHPAGKTLASSSLLIELQSRSRPRPRLYLVHPGGGNVYFYRDLAHHLGADQPICAIQARGLDSQHEPIDNIEEMAAHYLKEIRAFQPNGPYLFGGASFGGLVAYEMACQLQKEDVSVPLVILIDAPSPGHMPKPFEDDAEILVHLFGDTIPLSLEKLRAMSPERQTDYVIEQAVASKQNANLLPSGFGPAYLKVINAHLSAMYAYQPKKYHGNVVFYKHTEPMEMYDRNPESGWGPYLVEPLKVIVTPGNHITMNELPHVKKLCKHLRKEIDKIILPATDLADIV